MTIRKFLFTDANVDLTESTGAFEVSDQISVSSGVPSAGLPIITDGSGKIDSSFINFQAVKRYFLADYATTAPLPAVTYANGSLGVGATLTATANGAFAGADGETPVVGLVYLIKDQVAPLQNGLYTLTTVGDGSNPFVFTRTGEYDEEAEIEDGTQIAVGGGTVNADTQWLQINPCDVVGTDPVVFVPVGPNNIDAGSGLSFSGATLNVNTGNGIKIVADAVAVEPNDIAGTGLQDDGADNLEIDFANTATEMNTQRAVAAADLFNNGANQGAYILGADPSAIAQSSATTIQGILNDLSLAIADADEDDVEFTVGAGGVTAGDLVYISSNNTVSRMPINATHYSVGIAKTTVSASGTVKVLGDQEVLLGVLSGAVAGTKYFWSGTALTTTAPTTPGSYVWLAGYAKNSTDLYIDVNYVKKNA